MNNHLLTRLFQSSIVLAVLALFFVPQTYAQWEAVVTSDIVGYPGFGNAISLDGDRMLVGAPSYSDNEGAVYVFERREDGSWVQMAFLTPSVPVRPMYFGTNVSLDGDRALIGANRDVVDGEPTGAAYIFERQINGQWHEVARLYAGDRDADDLFGNHVALDGDRALVSAPRDENGAMGRGGSAYVFERQYDGSWNQVAQLTSSERNEFGYNLQLQGDVAVVNNWLPETLASVFERQPDGAWVEVAKLPPGDFLLGPFVVSSALSGDRIFISVQHKNLDYIEHIGVGYVYEKVNGVWSHVSTIRPSTNRGFSFFGYNADMYGDRIIAAGPQGALVFTLQPDGSWHEFALLQAPDESVVGGNFTSISGDRVAVNGSWEGKSAVHVFNLTDLPRKVYGYSFIDAETDVPVIGMTMIPDDAVFNLKQMPKYKNIRANVSGDVAEVHFAFEGQDPFSIDTAWPFALFGDNNGDFNDGRLRVGAKTLTATPYDGMGNPGTALTLPFTVVQEGEGLLIEEVYVIDASNRNTINTLHAAGTTVDMSSYGEGINMRADILGPAESVRFVLEPIGHVQVENERPYALFGDQDGDYDGVVLANGEYTLSVTAFRRDDARGASGETRTYDVTITGSTYSMSERSLGEEPVKVAGPIPDSFDLLPAYPNPFNPVTTIQVDIPMSSPVSLRVYDVLGREVRTVVDGVLDAGRHPFTFDAADLPSGTYLYRLETTDGVFVKKMLLVK